MCMHRRSSAAAALSLILTAPCLGQGPELGQVTSEAEIAAWDISISPDGAGLPPGGGTAKQGEVIYAARCTHAMARKALVIPTNRHLTSPQVRLLADKVRLQETGGLVTGPTLRPFLIMCGGQCRGERQNP